jgi:hypothetical protein
MDCFFFFGGGGEPEIYYFKYVLHLILYRQLEYFLNPYIINKKPDLFLKSITKADTPTIHNGSHENRAISHFN